MKQPDDFDDALVSGIGDFEQNEMTPLMERVVVSPQFGSSFGADCIRAGTQGHERLPQNLRVRPGLRVAKLIRSPFDNALEISFCSGGEPYGPSSSHLLRRAKVRSVKSFKC